MTVATILSNLSNLDPLHINDTVVDFNATLGPVDYVTFGLLRRLNLIRFKFANTSILGLDNLDLLDSQFSEDSKHFICKLAISKPLSDLNLYFTVTTTFICPNLTFSSEPSVSLLSTFYFLFPLTRLTVPLTVNIAKTSFTMILKMPGFLSRPFVDSVTFEDFENVSFDSQFPVPLVSPVVDGVLGSSINTRIFNGMIKSMMASYVKSKVGDFF